jgi:hypothetical protein
MAKVNTHHKFKESKPDKYESVGSDIGMRITALSAISKYFLVFIINSIIFANLFFDIKTNTKNGSKVQ